MLLLDACDSQPASLPFTPLPRHTPSNTQVTTIYVTAEVEALDRRMRQVGVLDEWQVQGHLQDACGQHLRLDELLHEQQERLRKRDEERSLQAAAAASGAAAAGGGGAQQPGGAGPPAAGQQAALRGPGAAAAVQIPGTPQGKQLGGSAVAGTPKGSAAAAAAAVAAQKGPLLPPLAAEEPQQDAGPALLVDAVLDNTGQLDLCYSHLKHLVSSCWSPREEHAPGLLLLQRHASGPNPCAAAKQLLPEGGILEAPPDNLTVLRLQSVTAKSAALQLPRGQHVLRVVCSDLLLHSVSLGCASDFEVLEDPGASGGAIAAFSIAQASHAVGPSGNGQLQQQNQQQQQQQSGMLQQVGEHEAIKAGGCQLLFRYLMHATVACVAGVRLGCSSTMLAAATRLLVVDNKTGVEMGGLLNRVEGLQVG